MAEVEVRESDVGNAENAGEPSEPTNTPANSPQTPGLDQLPPKSSSPADGLLQRAQSTGLSRDILAWREARGR